MAAVTPERAALFWQRDIERLITSVYSGRKEANDRSIALLKEWLSPAQREQYEQHGYFDVIGGDTGGRYRIHQPAPYNIFALADDGTVLDRICVVPQNVDAGGDVMLAQKIWLEKDEAVTLSIANKQSDHQLFMHLGADFELGHHRRWLGWLDT